MRKELREQFCKEKNIENFSKSQKSNYALWLEFELMKTKEQLALLRVVGQSEQLKALEDLKDFAAQHCPMEKADALTAIIKSL